MQACFIGKLLSFAERYQATPLSQTDTSAEMVFVLTDFQPNRNNQGIPIDEKENIMRTALYKPVKIAFLDDTWRGHQNASPIGPITSVIDEGNRIVATAVIWKREFPDIYETLKERQDDVYFSWELLCDSVDYDNGVAWLRGCEVVGVAIVDDPAYGTRTPLLAIASNVQTGDESIGEGISVGGSMDDISRPELNNAPVQETNPSAPLEAMSNDYREKNNNSSDNLTEQSNATHQDTARRDLEQYAAMLQKEIEELKQFKAQVERQQMIAKRRSSLPVSVSVSDDFLTALPDSLFDEFCSILATVRQVAQQEVTASYTKRQVATASVVIPDPIHTHVQLDPRSLGAWLRQRSR